jgi:hypothetical protein
MAGLVRTWIEDEHGIEGERDAQHLAEAPNSEVARTWEGHTRCGLSGTLHWVSLENVDAAQACSACAGGRAKPPPLEGKDPGPA